MNPTVAMNFLLTQMAKTFSIVFAVFTLTSYSTNCAAKDEALRAAFWATALSTTRASYESVLAEILLQKTHNEFGAFDFSINYLDVNYDRGRRVVAEGEEVNFFTNPLPARRLAFDRELNVLPVPVMKGLLGYRSLIVRKADLHRFKTIEHYTDLQKFRAGQVNYWADVPVYEENSLPLVAGTSLNSLFFMLSRERFDYIPLSIGEASQTLYELEKEYPDLAIVPNVLIYYPFPVFFQVSNLHPHLSERLTEGLKQVAEDGTLDKLFESYFHDVLTQLASEDLRVFALQNSLLPAHLASVKPSLTGAGRIIPSPQLSLARQRLTSDSTTIAHTTD